MPNNKKEFSILKWFVFPVITLALSAVVLWFNVGAFGLDDSIPYFIAMGVVFLCGLVLTHYAGHARRGVRIGAFIFEVCMWGILIGNAAYSFSAQRDMSITKQVGASQSADLKEIKGLKSGRAQSLAVAQLGPKADLSHVFSRVEDKLRAFMALELIFALGGVLTVYGLTAIRGGAKARRRPFTEQRTVYAEASPIPAGQGIGFVGKSREVSGSLKEVSRGGREETSQNFFKLKPQDSGIVVKGKGGYIGHISWDEWKALEQAGRTDYESIRNKFD